MPPKRKQPAGKEEESKTPGESEEVDDESKPAATDSAKTKSSDKKLKKEWTATEDDALLQAVYEDRQDREAEGNGDDEEDWDEIAKLLPHKTPVQCLKRYMMLNKKGSAKGAPEKTSPSGDKTPDNPDTDSPAAKKTKLETIVPPAGGSRWTVDSLTCASRSRATAALTGPIIPDCDHCRQ